MRVLLFFVLLLAGCTGVPVQPVPLAPAVAPACLRQCGELPVPANGQEATVRRWLYDLLDAYSACATAHGECATWVQRRHGFSLEPATAR